jgi:hypothetical protein
MCVFEAYSGIILERRRCRQKHKLALRADVFSNTLDKRTADTSPLCFPVHSQIRQVANPPVVGEAARNTYQTFAVSGGHKEVRILQHSLDSRQIIKRAAYTGAAIYVGELLRRDWSVYEDFQLLQRLLRFINRVCPMLTEPDKQGFKMVFMMMLIGTQKD